MIRTLVFLIFLATCWVLLSGHYTPLLLVLGVVSCLIVWWFSHRMDLVDHEDHPLHLHPARLGAYFGWLIVQVIKSNFDVALRIIDPGLPIQPKVFKVRTSQRTELGQVIYANSITLTPGTVSIDLEGGEIEVHALAGDPAASLLTGDMDARVTVVERSPSKDLGAGRP